MEEAGEDEPGSKPANEFGNGTEVGLWLERGLGPFWREYSRDKRSNELKSCA